MYSILGVYTLTVIIQVFVARLRVLMQCDAGVIKILRTVTENKIAINWKYT